MGLHLTDPVERHSLTTLWYSFYGNSQSITATVPANLLTALGTANVTAVSSTSTPATSNALTVSIIPPPPPTVSSISPNTGPINTAATLNINGTGFNFLLDRHPQRH